MKITLADTNDKLDLITSAAGSVDSHVSFVDTLAGVGTPGKQNQPAIATAATTDICAAPTGTTVRNVGFINIRNAHATVVNDVTVRFNDNGTATTLYKATLKPGEVLYFIDTIGWFVAASTQPPLKNQSVSAQGAGFATDTYLAGSNILLPGPPAVGTTYKLWFEMTKTGAGTATPIIIIRFGTAGAIGDTARATLTFGAGTAAIDTGLFVVEATFRTVGSGTSAVLAAHGGVMRGTGIVGSTLVGGAVNVGGGFDSTVAASIIGASFNGGTSFSGTVQLVRSELVV